MTPEEFGDIMDVGDLVAVHLTKYFPEGGRIKTLNTNFPGEILRNTVHFSLNHPVGNVGFYGNWDGTKYAVIVPLDKLCKEPENHLWNFNVVDTYFVGDVTLPSGSIILNSTPFHPSNEETTRLREKGIRYMVGNRNLRRNVERVIENEGYEVMPSGQWNWGCSGACPTKQRKIAEKLGAKYGVHFNDKALKCLEHWSGHFSSAADGRIRKSIEYFLAVTQNGANEDEIMDSWNNDLVNNKFLEGREAIKRIPSLIRLFQDLKEDVPEDYKLRIDKFLDINKARLRAYLPQEAMDRYEIVA